MKKEINLLRLIAAVVGVALGVAILVTFALNYNRIFNHEKETTPTEITSAETTSESKDYSLASLVLQDPTDEDFDDLANYTDLRELKISGSFSDSRLATLSKCLNLESLDLRKHGWFVLTMLLRQVFKTCTQVNKTG